MVPEVRTERLILRGWNDADRVAFAALNTDPAVVEYLPGPLTRAESDAFADRIETEWAEHGYGLWAVEVPGVTPFAGYVGLSDPTFEASFTPAVEVGWRLAAAAWGHGYATEAGRASLAFGFEDHGLDEIVSFTTEGNIRSRRVMERLGLRHDPADDFDHPRLPESPIRRHVLYRIDREIWSARPG